MNIVNFVAPIQVLKNATMTQPTYSTPLDMRQHTAVGAQVTYTGAAVGTITLEGSLDYRPAGSVGGFNAGSWGTVDTTAAWTAVNNNAGTQVRSAVSVAVPWVRLKYAPTSSTGTMNAWLCAK